MRPDSAFREAVERVRAMHQPMDFGDTLEQRTTLCRECVVPWPCPTSVALDSTEADVTSAQIRALSEWIDDGPSYVGLDSEAHTWRRIGKVGEEFGEVIEALLGVIGENQRKGKFGSMDDVNTELLDVATCALGAVEHNTGNEGQSLLMLAAHVASRFDRAGLAADPSPPERVT